MSDADKDAVIKRLQDELSHAKALIKRYCPPGVTTDFFAKVKKSKREASRQQAKKHGLREGSRTFCGITLYATKWPGEYDDAVGRRFEVAKNSADATCATCREMRAQHNYELGRGYHP